MVERPSRLYNVLEVFYAKRLYEGLFWLKTLLDLFYVSSPFSGSHMRKRRFFIVERTSLAGSPLEVFYIFSISVTGPVQN